MNLQPDPFQPEAAAVNEYLKHGAVSFMFFKRIRPRSRWAGLGFCMIIQSGKIWHVVDMQYAG